MARQHLILGIDPGTTTGYAAISLSGKIVEIASEKNLGLNEMVARVVKFGKVIICGTDKKKIPGFVSKAAASLGAKAICPDHDLLQSEKKDLVRNFPTNSSHEADALAAAFYALQRILPKLQKIEVYVKENKKERLADKIVLDVIRNETGIQHAVMMAESPAKPSAVMNESRQSTQLSQNTGASSEKLKERISAMGREIIDLRRKIVYLGRELGEVSSEKMKLQKILDDRSAKIQEKLSDTLKFREKRIRHLEAEIQKKDSFLAQEDARKAELASFILKAKTSELAKILPSLSAKDFEQKAQALQIASGDVLWIMDSSTISPSAISHLKPLLKCIIASNAAPLIRRNFVVIDPAQLRMSKFGDFAFIEKSSLNDALANSKSASDAFLENLVTDYRKERQG